MQENDTQEAPREEEKVQQSTPTKKSRKSGMLGWVTGIGVLLALAAIGAWVAFGDVPRNGSAVAMVNGEAITQGELDERVEAQLITFGEQAASVDRSAVEEQVLDSMVVELLLIQKAKESGVAVTDEEVEAQYTQSEAQFAEGEQTFAEALAESGLTAESFRERIRNQLLIERLVEGEVDLESVSVTAEEIQSFYDQAAAAGGDVPPLSEVRDQVEAQLVSQQQQILVQSYIEELRAESDIETMISTE